MQPTPVDKTHGPPYLFADTDLFLQKYSSWYKSSLYPINWPSSSKQEVLDAVFARLLLLFSDVVCIFADDYEDPEYITAQLSKWANLGSASTLPRDVRPQVVIVTSKRSFTLKNLFPNLDTQSQARMLEAFPSIIPFYVPENQLSHMAQHRPLKELLFRLADQARNVRRRHNCLFSALHLNAFFDQAVEHTAATKDQPFDFIKRSRNGNEVQDNYVGHLSTFLQLGKTHSLSYDDVAFFLASTIVLDSYPPGMHSETIPPFRYMLPDN